MPVSPQPEPAEPAGADEEEWRLERRVTLPRGMATLEFVDVFPDGYAQFLVFEDARGRGRCWRIGQQSADQYLAAADLPLARAELFHSPKVRIFFPIVPKLFPEDVRASATAASMPGDDADAPYFCARSMTLRGNRPTLARVLRAVQAVAAQAVALHLDADLGRPGATYGDVKRCLKDYAICRLLCRRVGGGNHVYVRL